MVQKSPERMDLVIMVMSGLEDSGLGPLWNLEGLTS